MQFTRTAPNTYSFVFPDEGTFTATVVNSTFITLSDGRTMTEVFGQSCLNTVLRHPQMPLSDGSTTVEDAECVNGVYQVSTSSSSGALAFDQLNETLWTTNPSYSFSGNASIYNGAVTTTLFDGTVVSGDWLQVKYPYRFFPSHHMIQSRIGRNIRHPFSLLVLGSPNGADWYRVQNFTTDPANMTL